MLGRELGQGAVEEECYLAIVFLGKWNGKLTFESKLPFSWHQVYCFSYFYSQMQMSCFILVVNILEKYWRDKVYLKYF
jgi:hypothetical protein